MDINNINNENYVWRPVDNSSVTRLKYSLEAKHWLDSIKSNTGGPTALGELAGTLGLIGALISIFMSLVFIILITVGELLVVLVRLIEWIISPKEPQPQKINNPYVEPSDEELAKMGEDW